jgi:hypothetical protein
MSIAPLCRFVCSLAVALTVDAAVVTLDSPRDYAANRRLLCRPVGFRLREKATSHGSRFNDAQTRGARPPQSAQTIYGRSGPGIRRKDCGFVQIV